MLQKKEGKKIKTNGNLEHLAETCGRWLNKSLTCTYFLIIPHKAAQTHSLGGSSHFSQQLVKRYLWYLKKKNKEKRKFSAGFRCCFHTIKTPRGEFCCEPNHLILMSFSQHCIFLPLVMIFNDDEREQAGWNYSGEGLVTVLCVKIYTDLWLLVHIGQMKSSTPDIRTNLQKTQSSRLQPENEAIEKVELLCVKVN